MNKRLLLFFSLLIITSSTFSQKKEKIKGNKNVTIKTTKVSSFNRLVIGEKFEIELIKGNEASIFIETDENLHEVINFTVSDSTLNFNSLKRITGKKKLVIKVTYTPTLKYIETLDNAEISSSTILDVNELTLKNTGNSKSYLNINTKKFKYINSESAKAELNINTKIATLELDENSTTEALINAETLQIDLFERAKASIEGQVTNMQLTADNSSDFKGKNLTTTNCEVICKLNADAYIQSLENLTIDASGNSEIYIYGNPKIVINTFSDTSKLFKKEK